MLENVLRATLTALLKLLFRVELRGIEHFEACRGQRTVIIANHQSFLDPMLLAVFMPEKPAFAMNVFQAEKWYFKPLLKIVDVFAVDPTKPMSTKSIIQRLKGRQKCVVFPEGRITTSGGIMKVYEGTGLIIDRTDALILPIRIEGAQFSKLSRLQGKMKLRWFPKITLTLQPPRRMELPADVRGRKRRAMSAARIYDILTEVTFRSAPTRQTLLQAIAQAARVHGMKLPVVTDITRVKITYRGLFTKAFALAAALAPRIGEKKNVAVLLPTTPGALLTMLALMVGGRVPAMLNYSAGQRNLLAACDTVQADVIISSRAFVERARLEEVMQALSSPCKILYLEDLKPHVTFSHKLSAWAKGWQPEKHLPKGQPDDAAVILYTSGSEGMPKGVVLSHASILSNIHQVAARIPFTQADMMLNALPIFHSFGLTGGTLLPLVLGIKTYLYPNPLHYRVVPEIAYDAMATIILGTDTFLNGYAKYAHPYDLNSVRLVVAGAEKVKAATRELYMNKYAVRILEGYGVTETSPVLAVNTPIENKPGTVGRPLPDVRLKLEPVEGLEKGSRLFVAGPNVMLGYMKHDKPGILQKQDEWYDTGDIVDIDAEGYISILGRAKRFAKVGGEMVSLTAVEEAAAEIWPEKGHAALAVPDPRKGEQILLITENPAGLREDFLRHAQAHGLPELMVPRRVEYMAEIPRLGSGKVDYMKLKELTSKAAAA